MPAGGGKRGAKALADGDPAYGVQPKRRGVTIGQVPTLGDIGKPLYCRECIQRCTIEPWFRCQPQDGQKCLKCQRDGDICTSIHRDAYPLLDQATSLQERLRSCHTSEKPALLARVKASFTKALDIPLSHTLIQSSVTTRPEIIDQLNEGDDLQEAQGDRRTVPDDYNNGVDRRPVSVTQDRLGDSATDDGKEKDQEEIDKILRAYDIISGTTLCGDLEVVRAGLGLTMPQLHQVIRRPDVFESLAPYASRHLMERVLERRSRNFTVSRFPRVRFLGRAIAWAEAYYMVKMVQHGHKLAELDDLVTTRAELQSDEFLAVTKAIASLSLSMARPGSGWNQDLDEIERCRQAAMIILLVRSAHHTFAKDRPGRELLVLARDACRRLRPGQVYDWVY